MPSPRRVLLAEDDYELRTLIASHLRAAGLTVTEAHNGPQLLEHLSDYLLGGAAPPDVVVSDLRMPGFNGLEVFAGVRAYDWNLPWVLITAFGDPRTHEDAKSLGAAAVLDKPLDLDELRLTVLALLDRPRGAPSPPGLG